MRQLGKQPVHDLVIRSIPTLWEKNGQQFVEINAGSDRNVCAALPDVYPDVIGFAHQNGPTQLLWVAEVETEDTITLHKARTRWQQYAALDVPLFLIVPVGYRDLASLVAQHEVVPVAGIYTYWFDKDELRVMNNEGVEAEYNCA